jgi:HD-GYP domain-containing protein (c-di-GMP phosphodiesterase class II)
MSDGPLRVPLPEVSDLIAPGEPLPFKVLDAAGRLLLNAGHVIAGSAQLQALLERGACVEYPDVVAVRSARAAVLAATAPAAATRKRNLHDRWEEQTATLDALLRTLGRDARQAADIEAFADAYIELVERDSDLALFHCIRQDDRRFTLYGVRHALHVATIVLLAARGLAWSADRSRRMVRAALTMNAAIVELQSRMAEQADPPSRKQIEQIQAHPARAAELLRASGVADADWLALVHEHHERPGGGGYPRALPEVGDEVRLLRAADVFSAKISPRALRAPLAPQLAARQLFQEDGGGPIAGALIKAVGIYPPGDFVRLRNGEAAIVACRARADQAVQVMVLQDAKGRPQPQAPRRDTALPDYAITGALAERGGLPRVLPEQVYGLPEP